MTRRFSPCIGICSATALGDPVCRGCGRTQEEVIHWNQLTPAAREAVWARLAPSQEGLTPTFKTVKSGNSK